MKKLIITLFVVAIIFYGGYRYVLSLASDELVNQLSQELLTEDVVKEMLSDPYVKDLVKELQSNSTLTNRSTPSELSKNMPFTTKEEATKTIVSRFSVGEIQDITTKAARGLTVAEQVELEKLVMERLTEEELEAIMIIGLSAISEELLKE
ncbi:hypothetical protein ACERII_09595 [Evansella sp. AB-rgal1]|uniref:hypothetical protein n=1 Tax=Evansella sp. AB-rgal1 TaxID=3242696 RepID=UPI00359D88E0